MNNLDLAYTVDLLSRLTESIETYVEDDRWDGIDVMHAEIKEAKYYEPDEDIDEEEYLDQLDDEDEHVDEDEWERDDD